MLESEDTAVVEEVASDADAPEDAEVVVEDESDIANERYRCNDVGLAWEGQVVEGEADAVADDDIAVDFEKAYMATERTSDYYH